MRPSSHSSTASRLFVVAVLQIVAVKFNSSDGVGLAGGVAPEEAADTVAELAAAGVTFLEISGKEHALRAVHHTLAASLSEKHVHLCGSTRAPPMSPNGHNK